MAAFAILTDIFTWATEYNLCKITNSFGNNRDNHGFTVGYVLKYIHVGSRDQFIWHLFKPNLFSEICNSKVSVFLYKKEIINVSMKLKQSFLGEIR